MYLLPWRIFNGKKISNLKDNLKNLEKGKNKAFFSS